MTWETVIGLEVHVQLGTRTKMFCACANVFGAPPNTQVCPVCLGLPGALPVPNAEAIRLAVEAALALDCTVHDRSVFARKNYFYPDLPKGYQISQFDKPLATQGVVHFTTADGARMPVGITRLHLEEDAGKSLHDRVPGKTAVDLNRCGAPLIEIVSEPDMRSPAEARAYLTVLKQILVYVGASECSMEKGSLRVDANLSIRRPGDPELGTKTELKNMNSFANVEKALEVERDRQIALVESGGLVEQVSQLFNPVTGTVKPMRSKEESHDYRYFPDPDLPPLVLAPGWVAERELELPELPEEKRQRFVKEYGVSEYHAEELTLERPVADYFEAVVRSGADPSRAVGWVLKDIRTAYNETETMPVGHERLAELIGAVKDGVLSEQAARRVFTELTAKDEPVKQLAERLGLVQVGDTDALGQWVDQVLAEHPNEVARFKGGETKLIGFFVGQVMKASKGKADPKGVQGVLREKLESEK
ncbi:MAG: Asp-tRNA(Asn)/Glu-tRNA(Gln) amidotransferase subunit GatB [Gemmatimonadales bacterium]